MTTTPCKGCGKPIIWAISPTGARIPLDANATVYLVERQLNGEVLAKPDLRCKISHFFTCPKREDFSGKGKRK